MGDFEPVIIGFLCKWCASAAASKQGEGFKKDCREVPGNCRFFERAVAPKGVLHQEFRLESL